MSTPNVRIEYRFRSDNYVRIGNVNIDKITKKLQDDVVKFVKFVQESVVKPHTPVRTGKLRRSIEMKVDRRYKTQIIVRCYAGKRHPVPYAWIVEEGAGVHDIYPVSGVKLKFQGTKRYSNRALYVNYVSHPGFGGYFMFQKGMTVIMTHLPKLLAEGIKSLPFARSIPR